MLVGEIVDHVIDVTRGDQTPETCVLQQNSPEDGCLHPHSDFVENSNGIRIIFQSESVFYDSHWHPFVRLERCAPARLVTEASGRSPLSVRSGWIVHPDVCDGHSADAAVCVGLNERLLAHAACLFDDTRVVDTLYRYNDEGTKIHLDPFIFGQYPDRVTHQQFFNCRWVTRLFVFYDRR